MATQAPVYKVVPTIELQASDKDYNSQLDTALFLAKFDYQEICLVSNDGRQIFCNRSLLSLFSKSIRNILDSSVVHQIPDTPAPIIIVPDCSGDSISKVHDILLNGSTRCSISSFNDINNVIETAKVLGIDMKDLGFVPFASLEQRRPAPQQLPKPCAPPPVEPNNAFKVKIPPPTGGVEIKKEKDDISIVGFAGDPNKAMPLNIKVEDMNEKVLAEVDQRPTLGNGESLKIKKKKKKHHKSSKVTTDQIRADVQEKISDNERVHNSREKLKAFIQANGQNIRASSDPDSSKVKNRDTLLRPGSLDENRPLSAKSVEVNKVHHARLAEMSDDELAFTSNTNYSTPPYTKTSIGLQAEQEEDPITMVSPDFFEGPDEDVTSTEEVPNEAEVPKLTSADAENINSFVQDDNVLTDNNVENTVVEEEVPVSYMEEEIQPVAYIGPMDENEVGPMRPLTDEMLQRNHLNHEVLEEENEDEEFEESAVNDSSIYLKDVDYEDTQSPNVDSNVSPEESFYGFPDVQPSDKDDAKIMLQADPGHFDTEKSALEIEDVELQIKKLEKELDNTLDTDDVAEPGSTQVSKSCEFQEAPKSEVPIREQKFDEENGDDSLDYNETSIGKTMSEEDTSNNSNEQHSDPTKSLMVDSFFNRIIEKDNFGHETLYNPSYDQVAPYREETRVSEDLEKIFGEGAEQYDEQMKSSASLEQDQNGFENSQTEQLPILNNMVNIPSEKLANLIGNNSISIGRTNEQLRKPEFSSDYSALRIERVRAKDRVPVVGAAEQIGNQPLRIERIGSSERSKSRPKHEAWKTGRGRHVPDQHGGFVTKSYENFDNQVISHEEEKMSTKVLKDFNFGYGTEFAAPKRYRSNSPAVRSHLPFERADSNLEMSIAKRSKKTEKHGNMKASNLDLQINKLKQTYSTDSVPIKESDFVKNSPEDLSSMSIAQLLEASKSAQSIHSTTYPALPYPTPHTEYAPTPSTSFSKSQAAINHSCLICSKSDFSGSNDNNKLTSIKAHYCNHFTEEILDLHKSEIMGNTCMISQCNMTIMDKGSKKRNLARHIGTKHNKIYKIMKLRGHRLEFLKNKEEKTKLKENRHFERNLELGGVGLQNVFKLERKPAMPVNERKSISKSADKIECNFCSRKYSNNFNLRKHILAAHDKMLD